nr:hypothetical protein [Streptomyces sp. SID5468]
MDMLIGELPWLDTEDEDLLALMVNAAMSSLKTGGKATFKDVIRANFEVTVDEFLTERGW